MAAETTVTSAKAWSPDIHVHAAVDAVPDALIMQTSTVAGSIEGDEPVVRVAYVDDAAASFVAEGAVIDESDPTLAETLVHTGKIAILVRLSREQYRQMGTPEALAESVRRAIISKANTAYVSQAAPVAPAVTPPAGLTKIADIETAPAAVATSLDSLIELIAALETNGADPTHMLLSPTAWSSLSRFKTGTGSALGLLGAGVEAPARRLLGLPVLVSNAVPANTGLIIDKRAIVSAVGNVEVSVSKEAYFSSDSIGVRAVWRVGQNIVRPDRIGTFTVTEPA
ncbi:phage major capsid protein [Ammonicoccus fulvus]|uniref:Phage major capsid protein n=1 Tax=Ammonicoccus fulvus TaxID=3138240 RepID=A0ABZ3FQC2_9ACTN